MGKVVIAERLRSYYQLEIYGKQREIRAVDDVSLTLEENEVLGIAGESGCGKSTLLRVIVDAVEPPQRVVSGRLIYVTGKEAVDVFSMPPEDRRRLKLSFISYVPQASMSVLNPVLKIKEIFEDFLKANDLRMRRADIVDSTTKHITELGLRPSILESYPHQLSGGMRQRVTIALATILKPKVIVADEPTTALDVVTQRGVIQVLSDLQRAHKNSIIIVTHDMGVHANIADRIAIMYAGRIVEEGPTSSIFETPKHPYTRFLIESVPRFGEKRRREHAPGNPPSFLNLPTGCTFHPRCPFATQLCKVEYPPTFTVSQNHKVACWLLSENFEAVGGRNA